MQASAYKRFTKDEGLEAQKSFALSVDALRTSSLITDEDVIYLYRQKPAGVDGEGRIVLEYSTRDELAASRDSPALFKVARQLREDGRASGIDRLLLVPPRERALVRRMRSGPPAQGVLYLPAALACLTLPHSRVDGSEFTRVNGRKKLTLLAPSDTGLPYGVYPRLALMHLTAIAIRTGQRTFYVGGSGNDFLALMGIGDSGGANGASTRARDQLRRLARTTFSYRDSARDSGQNIVLADRWVAWPERGMQVTVSELFFGLAQKHSVPLSSEILAKVRRSPMAIDAYVWLTYRASTLHKDTLIRWRDLEAQFGARYGSVRNFRQNFRRCVDVVKQHWDGIAAEFRGGRDGGLYLSPFAPSVLSWLERNRRRR